MLRDKMLAVMTDLRRDVVEREELIEAIAIALLTRKNLFILGDPGQAKSFVINGFRSRITGARQFERLLTKQADFRPHGPVQPDSRPCAPICPGTGRYIPATAR